MFCSFLPKSYSLTNRIMQTFAKFDRTKPHVNGTSAPTQSELSDTSITERQHLPPLSPSTWQPNKKPSMSSTAKSIRPLKKKLEVSPSIPPLSSTKQIHVIMLTSIVQATSITSRTWLLVPLRWMRVFWWCQLLTDLCLKPRSMCYCVVKLEWETFLSISTRWIL